MFANTEFLKAIGAIDQSERIINKFDRIAVQCSCGSTSDQMLQVLKTKLKKDGSSWRCRPCGTYVASIKRSTGIGSEGKSRKKTATRNEDILIGVGALDTTSRVIRGSDWIDFKCLCGGHGRAMFNNIFMKWKKTKLGWVCKLCQNAAISSFASSRTGPKNPFFGKVHTRASRIKIAAGHEKWVNENPDLAFTSVAEREILNWVRDQGLIAHKFRIQSQEIDIFIPSLNLGIEYNGLFWHSSARKKKPSFHLKKTNFFAERGIKIVHIFEHEWRDRKSQVKGFLKSAMRLNQRHIGARKLDFRVIDRGSSSVFLNEHHIQGASHATRLAIGGFDGDSLVLVSTFGPHPRNNKKSILNRFACESELTVSGGLSKVSKMARNIIGQPIISWCDKRWSDGKGYFAAGWRLDAVLKPDYFYTDGNGKVHPKQSRQKKSVNTPSNVTETQHARSDGLFQVWDCGKIRFVFD